MAVVIYPPNIKKDKDKLFACYSLVRQVIDEYNKTSAIASSNPDAYVKTGKFKRYIEKFNSYLQQLLAERNRLLEKIKWDNYTLEQWRKLTKLSQEEQEPILQELFGDKSDEKAKTTKATSPLLADLKDTTLDNLAPASLPDDPLQDYTGYTEYDQGNDITVAVNTLTLTAARPRTDTFYVYKDMGAAHFDGDYEHRNKVQFTVYPLYPSTHSWVLANVPNKDGLKLYNDDDDFHFIRWWNYNNTIKKIRMWEGYNSTIAADEYYNWVVGTVYYMTMKRDEAVGTYGTLYCYICTVNYYGESGSNLVDTLSIALHEKMDFRYIYALSSGDVGDSSNAVTGTIKDLDLQEMVAPTAGILTATNIGNTVARINGEITDDGGGECEARLRNRRTGGTETLRPNAPGDETNVAYQEPDSGAHWEKVDEESADDNTTYIRHVDGWARDLYNLPASSGASVINKITLFFRVRVYSNVGRVKGAIKSNSIVTETAEKDPYTDFGNETWGTYSQEWTKNPANNMPWEWADIDALQIGVALKGETGIANALCTQLYIEVDWGTAEDEWSTSEWQNTLETDDEYHEDLTELEPGTEYEFQTQAKNVAGEGSWTSSAYFDTIGGQPIMRRWGGSILPTGAQRIGKGW